MNELNLDSISLMAFADEDVIAAWREQVIENERAKEQILDTTTLDVTTGYNAHTDTAHTNYYGRGTGSHSDIAHTNSYDRESNTHTDTPHTDSYDRQGNTHTDTAHTDSYDRQGNTHTDTAHTNSYDRRGDTHSDRYSRSYTHSDTLKNYSRHSDTAAYRHTNRYVRSVQTPGRQGGLHTNYSRKISGYSRTNYTQSGYNKTSLSSGSGHTDSYGRGTGYSRVAHRDSYGRGAGYSRVAHRDSYGRGAGYSRVAHGDSYARGAGYSEVAHRDTYSRSTSYGYTEIAARSTHTDTAGYTKGFEHENYIPSAPELYNVDGTVISGELDIILASYDKNSDGYGSQDTDSIDIYYEVKLRRVQTLTGEEVEEEWQTLQTASKTEEFSVDLSTYPDGIYEVSTQAYNVPRTENGVAKTYISDINIFTFTVVSGEVGSDLTILNATEFYDYAYGLETYRNREGAIKNYVDSILYANADATQQKGLFVEIELKDEDINSYHKVYAGLEKDGVIIAKGYNVIFETDANGNPISGDKTGVVFIPLADMMDDGCFEDIKIMLDVTEYEDMEMTVERGESFRAIGVNDAKEIIYIDVDNQNPEVLLTPETDEKVASKDINIAFSDVGLGLKTGYYQIVEGDGLPTEDGWIEVTEHNVTITLNQSGDWTIYAKAMDKVGNDTDNETAGNGVSYGTKETYHISDAEAKLECPSVVKRGDELDVIGSLISEIDATDVKFRIQDYGNPQDGTPAGNKQWTTSFTIDDSIPIGTHVVVLEITLEDGTVLTKTKTVQVIDVSLIVPPVIEKGETLEPTGELDGNVDVSETEFEIKDNGDPKEGTPSGDNKWETEFPTDDIPVGEQEIEFTITLEDGTEITVTETIHVVEVTLDAPTVVKHGETLDVIGSLLGDLDATDTKFWIEGYDNKQDGTPSGNGKWNASFPITEDIPLGPIVVVFEVTLEDGTVITKTKTVQVVGEAGSTLNDFGVHHTDKWEDNRQKFNDAVSDDKKRDENHFWSGEKFVVSAEFIFNSEAEVNPNSLITKVTITNVTKPDGTPYEVDFTDYIADGDYMDDAVVQADGTVILTQKGVLWDETMVNRWGGITPKELTFEFTFADGTTAEYVVVVDNTIDYYLLHRNK